MTFTSRVRSSSGGRAGALVVGVLAGGLLATCAQTSSSDSSPSIVNRSANAVSAVFAPQPAFARATQSNGDVTIADVAERVVPSVVNISATRVSKQASTSPFQNDPFFRDFFGPMPNMPQERQQNSLGSGVIVSADGVVITNNHVVDQAEDIEVTLSDGRDIAAEVVGTDPKSDVAVIKLKEKVDGLQPLPFGDSTNARLGEVVLAVGNPFGVGQTVTMGIISATGRNNMRIVDYENFIQTDAAINPGNSGGALVNMRGELIGINTAILSRTGGSQGIGFAIPSNMAKSVSDSLLTHGKVTRGFLGVTIQDLDKELADGLGLSIRRGVLVSDVSPGSPAAKAGFKRGDVIVKMNSKDMTSTAALRNTVAMAGPGAVMEFDVRRGKSSIKLTANLGELPTDGKVASSSSPASSDEGVLSGAKVTELTDQLRQRFGLPADVEGRVVVAAVNPGSRAAAAGLRPGDVILEVNRRSITSVADLRKVGKAVKGNTVLLLIQRQDSTVFLTLQRK